IISNPEPCNKTMNNEPPQTLPSFDSTCYSDKEISVPCVSKPNFVDESSNIFNPPPQPPIYSCEFCGSNAQYGHYCTPQVPFINSEPGYSQDFNFQQDIHDFQQQYLCCDQCGGPHETSQCQQVIFYGPCCENCGGPHENFQCQPMNYYEPNPSYDSNYSGFDQFGDLHPQQHLCCDNCGGLHETCQCQPMNQNFYNSNSSGFDQTQPSQFPVIHPPPQETSIEILYDQEKDNIFKIKDAFGNEQYKSEDVQELFHKLLNDVQNIHEELAEYINTPGWNRPTFYNNGDDDDVDYTIAITPVLSIEELDNSLSMRDEHLDTIPATESDDASPHDSEFVSLEVEKIVISKDEEIEDDNLREKLLKVNLLIAKIEALKDNPTPSSEFSTNTTIQYDISLPEYDSFIFDLSNDQFPPTDRSDFTHEEFGMNPLTSYLHQMEDDHSPLLAYVVWIFLAYLTYPIIPPHLHSFGNEDTIFDPCITINHFYSFKPGLSHRCETFKKFNTRRSHLKGSPMEMLFSTLFPMDQ
nr:hypothetical protein [Tanacetum cinerariifolium]